MSVMYQEGYKEGLNWPDAWETHGEPGGPWIPGVGRTETSRLNHEQALRDNHDWVRGWKDGHAKKLERASL